jgi:hypothetical protein
MKAFWAADASLPPVASIDVGTLTVRAVTGAANGRLPAAGGGGNVGVGVGIGVGRIDGIGLAVVNVWSALNALCPAASVERAR